ncbi:MAG: MFS transporter [Desulfobacterales bacterium]|nr:MFS transporter [Desulfobacterales bacterium]
MASKIQIRLKKWVAVEPGELQVLIWSFVYFFALLCSYYIIRPLRDEMGIAAGVDHLQWLFTGTFLSMLAVVPFFGWVTKRFPVHKFVPIVYYFFIGNLLLFFVLFKSDITPAYVARSFFIWVSVYNLFIVSVFWSLMTDIFTNEQARRLFGVIAAGGTAGALTGPALTASLVIPLGPTNLLLMSAGFLAAAVLCIHRIISWRNSTANTASKNGLARRDNGQPEAQKSMGGGIFAGIRLVLQSPYLIGICFLIILYTTLATFLYFQQAQIVRDSFDNPANRTAVFAAIDFSVNALTVIIQIFLTSRIVHKLGLHWTLALIPLLLGFGFVMIGLMPVLSILIAVQILRRAGNYAVMKPAREMLYVVLGKEEKYKAKNFIDTAVYRGGDAVSAWAYAGLKAMGLNLAAIAFVAVPLCGIWTWISFKLGKKQTEWAP